MGSILARPARAANGHRDAARTFSRNRVPKLFGKSIQTKGGGHESEHRERQEFSNPQSCRVADTPYEEEPKIAKHHKRNFALIGLSA
jgi:hypothetical protein